VTVTKILRAVDRLNTNNLPVTVTKILRAVDRLYDNSLSALDEWQALAERRFSGKDRTAL
jgi:hypothetical protein